MLSDTSFDINNVLLCFAVYNKNSCAGKLGLRRSIEKKVQNTLPLCPTLYTMLNVRKCHEVHAMKVKDFGYFMIIGNQVISYILK